MRSSAYRASCGPAGRGGQGVWCGAHGACLGDSVWVVGAVPISGMWVGSHMARVKSQGQSRWGREGKVTIEPQIQYHPTPPELSRLCTPSTNEGLCGPLLMTHSRWGHHVSKPGSWGTGTPGDRQMAGAEGRGAGLAQRGLSHRVGGVGGVGGAGSGWLCLCSAAFPHLSHAPSAAPEVLGSPLDSGVRPGQLGRGTPGRGGAWHIVSDPCSVPACPGIPLALRAWSPGLSAPHAPFFL